MGRILQIQTIFRSCRMHNLLILQVLSHRLYAVFEGSATVESLRLPSYGLSFRARPVMNHNF